jgi:heterodisulfide reductase subunit A-like polyferredoxin
MDMTSIIENESIGAVLVCGAGVAGVQASLDLAGSGFKVYLLDSQAAIGGRMVQLDEAFPGGDCALCILSPKLVECARNRNIEIITLADIENVSGQAGNFKVKIRQNPRYVDVKKCEGCGSCVEVCPVNLPNEFDAGSSTRKAIFRSSTQSIPNVFTISKATGQAPCTASCPAGVNVQGSIALIAAGKYSEAYELVRQRCPMPASCGRVCTHPCQSSCNRASIDDAVSFAGLERFIGDYIQANPDLYPPFAPSFPAEDSKIAVLGGGAAGLTAATDLALMGYGVTLFEAKPQLGGMLRYGIPDFRLPKDVLDKEIQRIVDLGVEVKLNTAIARPKDLLKLSGSSNGNSVQADGFNAVLVATGAWKSRKLGIAGEDAQGVWGAVEFLCNANEGGAPQIGPDVLIIGGSDLALDAARCALRLPGVASVSLACIEGRTEMPAQSDLISQALEEGVVILNGLDPTRIEAQNERVVSLAFRACTSVYDNYRGYKRYNPLFDDSQVSTLKADTVIVAVGRDVDAKPFGMEMRPGGRILADNQTLATSIKGIFAGGEAALGAASVADAIAQGHKAAEAIDAYIRGGASIRITDSAPASSRASAQSSAAKLASNPTPDAVRRARVKMPQLDIAGRMRDAREVDLGYSLDQAVLEAQRCLSCGLCSECMQCVKACSAEAILHEQRSVEMELEVGSIILASGMKTLADRLGHKAESIGSQNGIYVADDSEDLKDIPESVIQGSAAAACAMKQLTAVRGTMTQRHEYPWERDVADEVPRIGVFVCHCGDNISSVVDVDLIVRQTAKLANVQYAEATMYSCSEANQRHIKDMMRHHRLNRLVVASCSSRTHEVLFQETLRECGLNQFLFAMTNIRDQCSWVHRLDAVAATAKAMDLVSMAVARARHLKQLPLYELPVTPSALILGGGLAGITAALNIAGQGFKAHLVEREAVLGGMLRDLRITPEGKDVQSYLRKLIDTVVSNPKISVYLNSDLVRTSGQVGNFTSIVSTSGKEMAIEHGVVIVATGGRENAGGFSPAADNPRIARILRSTLTTDGYFLEAHSKLRPVDLSNEGQFVCGLALAPCSVDEAIAQANAVAARTAAILSKPQLEIMGQIACVNPAECVACATCVKVCPYGAPAINALRKAEIQPGKCMGCGSCVAACPARTILLLHQEGETMVAMFDELLVSGGSL